MYPTLLKTRMNYVVRMLAMTDCGYSPVIYRSGHFAMLKQKQIKKNRPHFITDCSYLGPDGAKGVRQNGLDF